MTAITNMEERAVKEEDKGEKKYLRGKGTLRVWKDGDYEFKVDNVIVREGNISDNSTPHEKLIREKVEELRKGEV